MTYIVETGYTLATGARVTVKATIFPGTPRNGATERTEPTGDQSRALGIVSTFVRMVGL